jgi:hypothetical protein
MRPILLLFHCQMQFGTMVCRNHKVMQKLARYHSDQTDLYHHNCAKFFNHIVQTGFSCPDSWQVRNSSSDGPDFGPFKATVTDPEPAFADASAILPKGKIIIRCNRILRACSLKPLGTQVGVRCNTLFHFEMFRVSFLYHESILLFTVIESGFLQ